MIHKTYEFLQRRWHSPIRLQIIHFNKTVNRKQPSEQLVNKQTNYHSYSIPVKVKGRREQSWKLKNQQSLKIKIEYNKRDLFKILSDASLESWALKTTFISSCAVFCKCVHIIES